LKNGGFTIQLIKDDGIFKYEAVLKFDTTTLVFLSKSLVVKPDGTIEKKTIFKFVRWRVI